MTHYNGLMRVKNLNGQPKIYLTPVSLRSTPPLHCDGEGVGGRCVREVGCTIIFLKIIGPLSIHNRSLAS